MIDDPGSIQRMRSIAAHCLLWMNQPHRVHEAKDSVALDVKIHWEEIGDPEAVCVLNALIDHEQAELRTDKDRDGRPVHMRGRRIIGAVVIGACITSLATIVLKSEHNAPQPLPTRASLGGTNSPRGATFARVGIPGGDRQDYEVNRSITSMLLVAGMSTNCPVSAGETTNLGFIRFSELTDTVLLSESAQYLSESTHEFRIRFLNSEQAVDARLWSEQNGADTDKCVGFGTRYEPTYNVYFGQCCQAPLHHTGVQSVLDGQWHHVALVRTPTLFRAYIDGILINEQDSSGQPGACGGKCPRSLGAFRYSYLGSLTVPSVIADVDWIRISNTARYQGSEFQTPNESGVQNDDSTLLLYRFNELGAVSIVSEAGNVVGAFGEGFPGATTPTIVEHCLGDVTGDGNVGGDDLGVMLSEWGVVSPTTTTDWTCTPIMDTHDDPIRPSRSPRPLRG
jgi:hypothetical protein